MASTPAVDTLYQSARNHSFSSFITEFDRSSRSSNFYEQLMYKGDYESTAVHWALHRFPSEMDLKSLVRLADTIASRSSPASDCRAAWSTLNVYRQTPTQVASYWTDSTAAMEFLLYLSPESLLTEDTRGWDVVALCKRSVPDGIRRPNYGAVLAMLEEAKREPAAFRERYEWNNPHVLCRDLEEWVAMVDRDPMKLLWVSSGGGGENILDFARATDKENDVIDFIQTKLEVVRTIAQEFGQLPADEFKEKLRMWEDL
jgi:hypothetical protein